MLPAASISAFTLCGLPPTSTVLLSHRPPLPPRGRRLRVRIVVASAAGSSRPAAAMGKQPPHVSMEVGDDGVAVVKISNPPVNALAVQSKDGKFSGGFDINVIQNVHRTGDVSFMDGVSVDLVVNTIEECKKPVVAALQGLALGGGLELALGSHARIAAPGTQLGLPELSLGVIPGFGELLKVSREWALDIAGRRRPWVRSLHKSDKMGSLSEATQVLKAARLQAKKTAPNLPQHLGCLDAIEDGIVHGGYSGVLKEAEVFKDLVLSETSRGLVHVFFGQRATSKVPGVTDVGLEPRQIKKVAVIGGGLMGSGIATALITSNIHVVLKEASSEYLHRGMKTIEGNIRNSEKRGKLTKGQADRALSLLRGALDYSQFDDVDMVIEAVTENIPLKQKIFNELEEVCPAHCILATNTSTVDLNVIGENTTSQERIVGAHFFSPAHIMPLLEIVRTDKTSAQAILDLMTVGKAMKKVPVVVGNCTGFAVNRTFFPYSLSAHILAHLGVDIFRIDRVVSSFGLPMGPFQLQDLAGYGVAVAVSKQFEGAFPEDRSFKTPLIHLLIASGRDGKNNGRGYYIYEKGSKPKPDPSVLPIVEESRKIANIMPNGKSIDVSDQDILEMILFPVVNEAFRVLDENVVVRASDLDVASVLGMGFPSYRGGIMFWADLVGAKHICERLTRWSELYGGFFKPSSYLEERAARGIPLLLPAPAMAKPHVSMEVGSDGVAVIAIFNPPVNALAIPIINGLKEKFDEATRRNDVKAIVLTGKGGRFSGGFDINVFQKVHATGDVSAMPDVSVDLVVNTIEDCKKPVVAAVEGLALGGGLELALGSHARVAAPRTQLGLPELTLGVIPGFGGTQRLPRLVGLPKAIEMMLLSKPILSEEGQKLGLIDALVSSEELLNVSRQWALDIAERRKPWVRSLHKTDKIGSLSEARQVLKAARLQAKKTAPNMPQHLGCLDVIEDGIIHGGYNGVLKVPGVTDVGLKPRQIKKVAVIGGGLMGSGIATALITSNIYVVLKEVNSDYLLKGTKTIEGNIRNLETRGKLTKDKANKALSMLKGALDYSDFNDVDMVIEAVIENIPLKQKIFGELEKVCPGHCILATNTSTIDLNVIGEKTNSQDRIIGAHFFSPAHIMPLLEIVRTNKTSAQAILDLMIVGKAIKKAPVVVGNCTGFAVNRTFFPYSQSAHILIHLGVDVFRIDRVISSFGLPMGPFQLQDLAGYGVAVAVSKEFNSAFPDRTFKTPLIDLLIKNGRNGKNNGRGYYVYEKGSKPKPDFSVLPIIEESRRVANMMPNGKPNNVTDQDILEMILFPVVNEACRVLDEDVVVRASDLDIASVLGMSFPSYRGGIVFWADLVGAKHVYDRLSRWSELYGGFFKPSSYLEVRAARGIPLSAPASSLTSSPKSRL
ncbi:unnamed protein product [Linum tenue]|uniref:3-hydroxyacyl-CoA dehydrogenase n=1 Tax=Linum tenue TaxID=586396 RepID=A0AAV0S9Y7_9ROSI|nr:unnamed protein product [Linum tenue]